MEGSKLAIFLLVLKHIFDEDMTQLLRDLRPLLQQVENEPGGIVFLEAVLTYLLERREEHEYEQLEHIALQSLKEDTREGLMIAAEAFRQRLADKDKEIQRQDLEIQRQGQDLQLRDLEIQRLQKSRDADIEQAKLTAYLCLTKLGYSIEDIAKFSGISVYILKKYTREISR